MCLMCPIFAAKASGRAPLQIGLVGGLSCQLVQALEGLKLAMKNGVLRWLGHTEMEIQLGLSENGVHPKYSGFKAQKSASMLHELEVYTMFNHIQTEMDAK